MYHVILLASFFWWVRRVLVAQKAGGGINISEALGALTRRQIITFGIALVATALAAILTFTGAIIVYDGKSTWLEGLTLVGLYCILAVSF